MGVVAMVADGRWSFAAVGADGAGFRLDCWMGFELGGVFSRAFLAFFAYLLLFCLSCLLD
jgi:hypothetical protein